MRAWVALVTLALALGAAHAQDMGRILVPHKGLNQLPAGGPKFSIPFDGKWYEPPALPANHYRGAYVSLRAFGGCCCSNVFTHRRVSGRNSWCITTLKYL